MPEDESYADETLVQTLQVHGEEEHGDELHDDHQEGSVDSFQSIPSLHPSVSAHTTALYIHSEAEEGFVSCEIENSYQMTVPAMLHSAFSFVERQTGKLSVK